MRYVAFLRGINVGKHQRVTMERLRDALAGLDLSDLATYIQSGNVTFESDETDDVVLGQRIERRLRESLGLTAPAAVRTIDHITRVVRSDPFGGRGEDARTLLWVSLLTREPTGEIAVPWLSPKGDLELVSRAGLELFTVVHLPEDRRLNSANAVERLAGVPVTNRGWGMLKTFVEKRG